MSLCSLYAASVYYHNSILSVCVCVCVCVLRQCFLAGLLCTIRRGGLVREGLSYNRSLIVASEIQ